MLELLGVLCLGKYSGLPHRGLREAIGLQSDFNHRFGQREAFETLAYDGEEWFGTPFRRGKSDGDARRSLTMLQVQGKLLQAAIDRAQVTLQLGEHTPQRK